MGLPYRNVEFQSELDKPAVYVHWDNILYRPDLFLPMEHEHLEITQDTFNNLVPLVETVPPSVRKGQLFFITR